MSSAHNFNQAYSRLNKAQKQAVDHIEGPVMVIAGPGTGKTQILTLRIANILKQTDQEPENILALTFTEAGVRAMQNRLRTMIGSAAYQVSIYTFHGFANSIIMKNPEAFPRIIGGRPATDTEVVNTLEEIIIGNDLKYLKTFGEPLYYLKAIKSAITTLKREGISPEELSQLVQKEYNIFKNIPDLYHEKGRYQGKMKGKYQKEKKILDKNNELVDIYRQYEESLSAQKIFDYGDMLMELLRALKENEELKLTLQEQFQYFLVDEHQDTNNAQNKILELLADFHQNPNLFAVGDQKQSIYRFQGANLQNFFYFKYLYPNSTIISLENNYRSSQTILNAADSLIKTDTRLKKSNQDIPEKQITIGGYKNKDQELFAISEDIKDKLNSGTKPEDIAILYRNNYHAFAISDMLNKQNIPHRIESDQDIFTNHYIKQLQEILFALHYFSDSYYLSPLLFSPLFNLDPLDSAKISRYSYEQNHQNLYDIISNEDELKKADVKNTSQFTELFTKLTNWFKESKSRALTDLLEYLLHDSGLLKSILQTHNPDEHLDNLNTFFKEAKTLENKTPGAKLSELIDHLESLEKHDIRIKMSHPERPGFVRLMTCHRSKGLEFSYVYITHAINGIFGNKRDRELLPLVKSVYGLVEDKDKDGVIDFEPDTNDDDRRLFYVALTRAKEHVYISYHQYDDSGKELLPTQFISEIDEETIDYSSNDIEEEYQKTLPALLENKFNQKENSPNTGLKNYLVELFHTQPLSVSALNNYLKSPWQYLFKNLLRLPSTKSRSQDYGTIIHAALNDFFNEKKDNDIDLGFLLAKFDEHLSLSSLKDSDKDDLKDKGRESLTSWYHSYQNTWNTDTDNEYPIKGVMYDDTLRLTGILDKIEYEDKNHTKVTVVDYKTGKPKSENQILGKTKDKDKSYFRQLVFYRLLLDLHQNGRLHMTSGTLDFIDPNDTGNHKKHTFTINEDHIEELKTEIDQMKESIENLSFWDTPCDEDKCDYCDLVPYLKQQN